MGERKRERDYFWPRGRWGGLREENALELSVVTRSMLQREVAGSERHCDREEWSLSKGPETGRSRTSSGVEVCLGLKSVKVVHLSTKDDRGR